MSILLDLINDSEVTSIKKEFFVDLGIVVGITSVYFILMWIFGSIITNALIGVIVDIIIKIATGIGAVFVLKYRFNIRPALFKKKGLLFGIFIYGAMLWIYTILNYIAGISPMERTIGEALPILILYFVMCIGIGFVEEMIYRGVIFGFIDKYLKDKKYGVVLSILISSVIFGLCHLLNLISRPHMIVSTITQVIYATIIGAYFAVIYYKSGNILAPIILHAIFDFVYYLWFALSRQAIIESNIDITLMQGVVSIVLYIPIVVWSILCFIGLFDFYKIKESSE